MLVHRPTGLQVKCQATRQQGLNRFLARRLLLDKIEEKQKGYVASERARIEKIRRQKRRRSRRAKERMLADKAQHSEKKNARRSVAYDWAFPCSLFIFQLSTVNHKLRLIRMHRLTKHEQLVFCIILGLLLIGWTVKTLRAGHPSAQQAQQATP